MNQKDAQGDQNRENHPPQPKTPQGDTVRREIDRIARQLDGLTKSLKRVKDAL